MLVPLSGRGLRALPAIALPLIWIFQTVLENASFFPLVGALVPWQPNWLDLEVCLRSWRLFLLPAAIKTMHWDAFQKWLLFPSEQIWVGRTLHSAPSDMVSNWSLHLHLSPCYWRAILRPVIMMSENQQWPSPWVLSLAPNPKVQNRRARCAEKSS